MWYPDSNQPPDWAYKKVEIVRAHGDAVDSSKMRGLTSDKVLQVLEPQLTTMGFEVETGKKRAEKVRRPVLFGENGIERVAYEVDGYHGDFGIVLEIEAGRGARGNATYRDLVRTSLIVGARYLALGVMLEYHHNSGGAATVVESYRETKNQLDAIFASGRLGLPFEGILLIGY